MDPPVNEHDKSRHAAIVPTGGVIPFVGEIPPHGWLLCNGKQYSNQEYPELFNIIQTKYVPDSKSWIIEANKIYSEKMFCVPDLRGRVIVGIDGATANDTLGASAGNENVIVIIDEMLKYSRRENSSCELKYTPSIYGPLGDPLGEKFCYDKGTGVFPELCQF